MQRKASAIFSQEQFHGNTLPSAPTYISSRGASSKPTLAAFEAFLPSEQFASSLDTQPFVFQHRLGEHELFSLPRLKGLVEQVGALPQTASAAKGLFRAAANPGLFHRKAGGPRLVWGTPEFQAALNEAFDNMDTSETRIKLSNIHKIEGYGELLRNCASQLSELTGVDFAKRYRPGLETLFISSPGQVTPYHVDEETNFLLQICGTKDVMIYDGHDRTVLTSEQIEDFFGGNCYVKRNVETPKMTADLKPGFGVHNPPFFPHMVVNGPSMSVSLSIGFELRQFPVAEVHRMNAYLRKAGLEPSAPGAHPAMDNVKSTVMRYALRAKRSVLGA